MDEHDYILRIGDLAERYGVSTETIRNWEKQQLIPPSRRTLGGHRRYSVEHLLALDAIILPQAAAPAQTVVAARSNADAALALNTNTRADAATRFGSRLDDGDDADAFDDDLTDADMIDVDLIDEADNDRGDESGDTVSRRISNDSTAPRRRARPLVAVGV